jgi:hypothetical protein
MTYYIRDSQITYYIRDLQITYYIRDSQIPGHRILYRGTYCGGSLESKLSCFMSPFWPLEFFRWILNFFFGKYVHPCFTLSQLWSAIKMIFLRILKCTVVQGITVI